MATDLTGVRSKINRAKKHLDDFHAAWDAQTIITTEVKVVSVEEQTEGRRATVEVTSGDLSPELGIPIGDAVHCLRSSLDHLICQLAIAAGNPAACERTQFPIFSEDTPKYRKRMEGWIKDISGPAQTEIKDLQPYKRKPLDPTGDLLWMLSELDNIDKHRLLLVTRAHFRDMLFSFAIDGKWRSVQVGKRPEWQPLKFGTEPLRFRLGIPWDNTKPETEVEVKATPVVAPVFQKTGLKCDGCEVFSTVTDMITDVKGVVDIFTAKGLI